MCEELRGAEEVGTWAEVVFQSHAPEMVGVEDHPRGGDLRNEGELTLVAKPPSRPVPATPAARGRGPGDHVPAGGRFLQSPGGRDDRGDAVHRCRWPWKATPNTERAWDCRGQQTLGSSLCGVSENARLFEAVCQTGGESAEDRTYETGNPGYQTSKRSEYLA